MQVNSEAESISTKVQERFNTRVFSVLKRKEASEGTLHKNLQQFFPDLTETSPLRALLVASLNNTSMIAKLETFLQKNISNLIEFVLSEQPPQLREAQEAIISQRRQTPQPIVCRKDTCCGTDIFIIFVSGGAQIAYKLPGTYGVYKDAGWIPPQDFVDLVLGAEVVFVYNRDQSDGQMERFIVDANLFNATLLSDYNERQLRDHGTYPIGYLSEMENEDTGESVIIDTCAWSNPERIVSGVPVQFGRVKQGGEDVHDKFWDLLLEWSPKDDNIYLLDRTTRRTFTGPKDKYYSGIIHYVQDRAEYNKYVAKTPCIVNTQPHSQKTVSQLKQYSKAASVDFFEKPLPNNAIATVDTNCMIKRDTRKYPFSITPTGDSRGFYITLQMRDQIATLDNLEDVLSKIELEMGHKVTPCIEPRIKTAHTKLTFSKRADLEKAVNALLQDKIVDPSYVFAYDHALFLRGPINEEALSKQLAHKLQRDGEASAEVTATDLPKTPWYKEESILNDTQKLGFPIETQSLFVAAWVVEELACRETRDKRWLSAQLELEGQIHNTPETLLEEIKTKLCSIFANNLMYYDGIPGLIEKYIRPNIRENDPSLSIELSRRLIRSVLEHAKKAFHASTSFGLPPNILDSFEFVIDERDPDQSDDVISIGIKKRPPGEEGAKEDLIKPLDQLRASLFGSAREVSLAPQDESDKIKIFSKVKGVVGLITFFSSQDPTIQRLRCHIARQLLQGSGANMIEGKGDNTRLTGDSRAIVLLDDNPPSILPPRHGFFPRSPAPRTVATQPGPGGKGKQPAI